MKSQLTLRYTGMNDARRYYVQRQDGSFWSGLHWSRKRSDAALWASLRDAQIEFNCLAMIPYRGKPVRDFECRLSIQVYGDQDFSVDDLRDYLDRTLAISIESQGDGPLDDSFVMPYVLVGTLRPHGSLPSMD